MRGESLFGVAFAIAIGGCAATTQQVANTLQTRYIGQSVDQMVIAFGPPASYFQMSNGGASYSWQLGEHLNINVGKYGGSASTRYCRVRAVTNAKGIVTSISTEDAWNMLGESLCAMRLGLYRQF